MSGVLGPFSSARDKALQELFDRPILLDLSLEVLSKAGDHLAGYGAGDLLLRRLPGFVILFDEESLIKRLVGVVCFHRVYLSSKVVQRWPELQQLSNQPIETLSVR